MARRRKRKSTGARRVRHRSGGCRVETRVIRKGRRVLATFKARVGSGCTKKARRRTPQNAAIARAGRACRGKGPIGGAKRNACLRAQFR